MATTFRFLASPEECHVVLHWFTEQADAPEIHPRRDGLSLFYSQYGPLMMTVSQGVDTNRSPVVLFIQPQVRHGILWAAGEVQFLPEKMSTTFPALQRLLVRFRKWLRTFPVVFRQPRLPETSGGPWDYYLEGGIRNVCDELYALPGGMAALQRGQYFVWQGASSDHEVLIRQLRLRGVECPPEH